MKFVCPVCGYVFDEAQENAAFSSLPETWQCPICKAAKSLFTPQEGEAPTISGEPAQAEELRPLTPGELAAVFSNLARGCEKQYHPEEEARFQELAAYFAGLAPQEPDASVAQLLALFQEDLAQGYPAYQAAAQAAGDRGSQRVRVWGEKVTTMVRSLLEQGVPRSSTAFQAIGYKELLSAIDGQVSLEEAVEEVKLRSRQYAKRQLTWLRRNQDIHWIYWEKERDFAAALQIATEILAALGLQ